MLKSSENFSMFYENFSIFYGNIVQKIKKEELYFYDPSMSFKSFSIMFLTSRLYYCQQQEALSHQLFLPVVSDILPVIIGSCVGRSWKCDFTFVE